MPLKAAVGVSSALVLMSVGGHASAAPVCDGDDFVTDGVFDTDGYLACLAGDGGVAGAGGGLPATGSDTMRLVAIAGGLAVVGIGAVVASKRRASEPAAAEVVA